MFYDDINRKKNPTTKETNAKARKKRKKGRSSPVDIERNVARGNYVLIYKCYTLKRCKECSSSALHFEKNGAIFRGLEDIVG
jgi:hypothetical protein